MNPVSWLEVIWVLVALIGTSVNLMAVVYAIGDMGALRALQLNGEHRIAARIRLRSAISRLVIQAMFLILGLWSAATPPAPPRPDTVAGGYTALGVAFLVGLMLAEVILAGSALLEHLEWRRLVALGERVILEEALGKQWNGEERRRR